MNNKRRLWQIFGPVICAFVLLVSVFLLPWNRAFSAKSVYKAAVSQNDNVFRGQEMKQTAFAGNYVPFYGSSELSRIDPLHPSVLAKKYHRSYQPFLLGGPGSQSLSQFFGMQPAKAKLIDKKAVFIVSPQWFVKQAQNPQAFSLYFSHLQAIDWILDAKDSVATRYAARRLLQMPSGTSSYLVKYALMTLASGRPLSDEQRLWLKIRRRMLVNEDKFFTLTDLRNRTRRIEDAARVLPDHYSVKALHEIADQQGQSHTSGNPFGIDNDFFKHRLNNGRLGGLYHSQTKFNYVKSLEYSDFQLVLNQFAHNHENVLFVIPPVNAKWAHYTGLSMTMYQQAVTKIKHQLVSQGFYHIADLSKAAGHRYFMQDTIHLGWNGWLAMDRYVAPFMAQSGLTPSYRISNYYFTKNWQNRTQVKPVKLKTQTTALANENQIKNTLLQNKFKGSALIIKNGKVVLNDQTGDAVISAQQPNTANTSFLINSVQKPLTGTLVMRQIEAGNLHLHDKLSKFYPNVPHSKQISVQQLLDMTSGLTLKSGTTLGRTPFLNNQDNIAHAVANTIFLKKFYGKRLYTSLNYVLLCGILEKVTHQTYEQLFKATFVTPLHLKHTDFIWSTRTRLNQIHLATSYVYVTSNNKKTTTLAPSTLNLNEIHGELGAGSVAMSNGDLYKVVKAIFTGKLLTRQSRKQLFKGPAPIYYGGGFYNMPTFHAANGAGNGYYTFLRVSKDGKDAVILQANQPISNFWKMRRLADQMMALTLG